jgi:excinuclease ABC subunit A
VANLLLVLDRLAARGNALVVVEHHTGLLSACDRLIELGPVGGADGGRVVATGTPAQIAANPDSVTGPWLEEVRARAASARRVPRGSRPRKAVG